LGDRHWDGLEELRDVLRAFLRRDCTDDNEVDDVIQETFLRAARHRTQLEPRRLKPWAMRIAQNVLVDVRRRGRRIACSQGELDALEAREEPDPPPEAPLQVGGWLVERDAALGHLKGALSGLAEADRRVLGSFYGGGESCRTTASECEIPAHLVKVRLFRARKRLWRALRQRLALNGAAGTGVWR